jgi:hypothetical protein
MSSKSFWSDNSNFQEWKELLGRLPSQLADIYFYPEYVGLYENDFSKATCFAFTQNNKIFLYPFLINCIKGHNDYKYISTPYGYGGPITNSNDSKFLKEAFSCLDEILIGNHIIAEVIKFHPLIKNHEFFNDVYDGNISRICSTVFVETQINDEEDRWMKTYTHSNRKNIKKAVRNGAKVEFSSNVKAWDKFVYLYEKNLIDNEALKKYFFGDTYFYQLKERLIFNSVIASCLLENEIVSSLLIIYEREYAHCHLIGTLKDKKTIGVNNLLHHKVVRWCEDIGIKKLHLGGGRSNSEDDSLLRFKKNFSDKISDFYIGERILNHSMFEKLSLEWSRNHNSKEPFIFKNNVS